MFAFGYVFVSMASTFWVPQYHHHRYRHRRRFRRPIVHSLSQMPLKLTIDELRLWAKAAKPTKKVIVCFEYKYFVFAFCSHSPRIFNNVAWFVPFVVQCSWSVNTRSTTPNNKQYFWVICFCSLSLLLMKIFVQSNFLHTVMHCNAGNSTEHNYWLSQKTISSKAKD